MWLRCRRRPRPARLAISRRGEDCQVITVSTHLEDARNATGLEPACPRQSSKKARVRISMLSRGGASAGVWGCSKAECAEKRARPSVLES